MQTTPNFLPGIAIQLSETGYDTEDPYFLGATIPSKLKVKSLNCLPGIVIQLSETGYNTEDRSFTRATVLSKLKH